MFGLIKNRLAGGAKKTVGGNLENDQQNTQNGAVLYLSQNTQGRDFVVGDIHGHFELVEQLLKSVSFNESVDRLISVGDCIDRGPESHRALAFLEQPWFYSIRGNHEAMLIDSQAREYGVYELWMKNGGEWSDLVSDDFLNRSAEMYKKLPYAIEIETKSGIVGVVHADVPPKLSWGQLTSALSSGRIKPKDCQKLLWSRDSYRNLRKSRENPEMVTEPFIKGVNRIYLGHSIVNSPCLFGNLMFIDTGAYMTGNLTAVDLNNEEIIMVQNKVMA